jgi:hypothetical protein
MFENKEENDEEEEAHVSVVPHLRLVGEVAMPASCVPRWIAIKDCMRRDRPA